MRAVYALAVALGIVHVIVNDCPITGAFGHDARKRALGEVMKKKPSRASYAKTRVQPLRLHPVSKKAPGSKAPVVSKKAPVMKKALVSKKQPVVAKRAPVLSKKAPAAKGKMTGSPVCIGKQGCKRWLLAKKRNAPTYNKAPVTKGKAPVTKGKAPVTKGKAPVTKGKAPVTKGKAPVTKGKAPACAGNKGCGERWVPQKKRVNSYKKVNVRYNPYSKKGSITPPATATKGMGKGVAKTTKGKGF